MALGGNIFGPSAALQMANLQTQVQDQNQANLIGMQIAMDGRKTQMEMASLQRSMQTTIYKVTQETSINQAKQADGVYKKANQLLQSAG